MSEYWKSTPKYWCKHCSAYVKDTPFERKQHESTAKHQNNLKRFLRDIQNSHERTEREKVQAKAEVERLKGTFASRQGESANSGNTVAKPDPRTARTHPTTPQTAADQKRQWAQLADMGIKVPEQARSEMAMAGDWRITSQQTAPETKSDQPLSIGIKKRKFERQGEDEEAGETVVRRGWGATTKLFPDHQNADLDDLLSGSIALGKKEKPTVSRLNVSKDEVPDHKQEDKSSGLVDIDTSSAPVQLEDGVAGQAAQKEDDSPIKDEPDVTQTAAPMDHIPKELTVPVFKKRKAKVS